MLSWLSKYLRFVNLAMLVCAGAVFGLLAAIAAGMLLEPQNAPAPAGPPPQAVKLQAPTLSDYGVIVERNIFNHEARGAARFLDQNAPSRVQAGMGDASLLGTVVADQDSLALIRLGGENGVYRLGEQLPGGAEIETIERNRVLLRESDGTQRELIIEATGAGPARAQPHNRTADGGIRELGPNRWMVSRGEVEKARGNLNALLTSARMEPKIENGRTEGFVVKMIRPKSLLERLGLKRDDLVREVNGVALDSPEKALQIFQQLREAKRIVIGLERQNQPINLEYTIE